MLGQSKAWSGDDNKRVTSSHIRPILCIFWHKKNVKLLKQIICGEKTEKRPTGNVILNLRVRSRVPTVKLVDSLFLH